MLYLSNSTYISSSRMITLAARQPPPARACATASAPAGPVRWNEQGLREPELAHASNVFGRSAARIRDRKERPPIRKDGPCVCRSELRDRHERFVFRDKS